MEKLPLELRVDIEREARRMAGYWHGKQIAEIFLQMIVPGEAVKTNQNIRNYLDSQDDPRLEEIVGRLGSIFADRYGEA